MYMGILLIVLFCFLAKTLQQLWQQLVGCEAGWWDKGISFPSSRIFNTGPRPGRKPCCAFSLLERFTQCNQKFAHSFRFSSVFFSASCIFPSLCTLLLFITFSCAWNSSETSRGRHDEKEKNRIIFCRRFVPNYWCRSWNCFKRRKDAINFFLPSVHCSARV